MSPHHLSLPITHNCVSTVLLLHPLNNESALTLLFVLVLCMELQHHIPLLNQMNSPPFAFVHSSDCIFYPPVILYHMNMSNYLIHILFEDTNTPLR
ncbi:BEL1 homeodomain protein [Trifolium repens]|nr:BEL1 homeodomain protein [Trifolium repens]